MFAEQFSERLVASFCGNRLDDERLEAVLSKVKELVEAAYVFPEKTLLSTPRPRLKGTLRNRARPE